MGTIAAAGATLACSLFAGAALYITLVEHPARVRCGTETGVAQFRHSYPRAARMQAPLAVAGGLLALAAWLAGEPIGWLAAGGLLAAVVPFTLLIIFPTNHRLLDRTLDLRAHQTGRLLEGWGRLHFLRTTASLLSLVGMLWLLAG